MNVGQCSFQLRLSSAMRCESPCHDCHSCSCIQVAVIAPCHVIGSCLSNLWYSAVLNLIEQVFVDCEVRVGAKEIGDYDDVPGRVGSVVSLQTRGSNQDSEKKEN